VIKRLYYGWLDPKTGSFRVSRYPPDAPVRPSAEFSTKADVMSAMQRKRAEIYWWPPLPEELSDEN
jgi:hypothetical protein